MAPPRKKKAADDQMPLRPAAHPLPTPVVEPTAPPKFLEYTPASANDRWQVEHFDLLAVEFCFGGDWVDMMSRFHVFCEPDTQRWWIVRRLFGVVPLIPPDGALPDDLRSLTRVELCAAMGITPPQLGEELTHLKTAWALQASEEQRSLSTATETPGRMAPESELPLGDTLLKRFDFDKALFEEVEVYEYDAGGKDRVYQRRDREKSRKEMEWFVTRLMRPEWQKMLEEPMAGSLARTALVNELYLHRFDSEMMTLMPNTPRWKDMSKSRQEIEDQYQSQLAALKENFPELGIASRVTSRAIVSDLNLAHRQYYGHNQRRLWDGVHTAAEIVFMMRTSAQLPVPRYRLGWQIMVVEARHGLLDPNFRSLLKKADLKKLDRGFQRGVEEARTEDNEKQVDLERGVIPGEPNCDEFPDYLQRDAGLHQGEKAAQ